MKLLFCILFRCFLEINHTPGNRKEQAKLISRLDSQCEKFVRKPADEHVEISCLSFLLRELSFVLRELKLLTKTFAQSSRLVP